MLAEKAFKIIKANHHSFSIQPIIFWLFSVFGKSCRRCVVALCALHVQKLVRERVNSVICRYADTIEVLREDKQEEKKIKALRKYFFAICEVERIDRRVTNFFCGLYFSICCLTLVNCSESFVRVTSLMENKSFSFIFKSTLSSTRQFFFN